MLAQLLGAVLSGEASATAKRVKTQVVVFSILGVFALLGACFLLLAGYLYAAQHLGALQAALWFGGVLLGAAVLGYVIYRATAGARAKREARRRRTELTGVAAATALAALPTLATRGGAGLVLAPFLAAVGYQIYKENTRTTRKSGDGDDE